MAAIEVRSLRKSYDAVEVLRGLDLVVERGEVFALLGPNGAGKTTAVEILEGHRKRDGGEVHVLGVDPEHVDASFRERVGIVLQTPGVEPYLTVEESIEQYRGYYSSPRPLDEILDVVGLREQRGMRVRRLSGGQQRRLDVALGLAGDPELLFLDEPTTGFDPSARRQAWEMVRSLRALGTTVLLTTHYMDEAEYLADRVAMIVQGEVVALGTPAELTDRMGGATISFRVAEPDAGRLVALLEGIDGAERDGQSAHVRSADPTVDLNTITGRAMAADVTLQDLSVERPSLEDAYLWLARRPGDSASDRADGDAG